MTLLQLLNSELFSALRAKRPAWWMMLGVSAAINLLALAPSIYMLQVYDRVMVSQNLNTLWMLTVFVAGVLIVSGLLEHLRSATLIRLSNAWDVEFSSRLFRTAVNSAVHTGGSAAPTQAIRDFSNVRQFATSQGVLAALDAPWIVIYVAVLFMFNPWFGGFGVGCILVSVALTLLNSVLSRKPLHEANLQQIKSSMAAESALKNGESIAAMGMHNSLEQHWLSIHRRFLQAQTTASDCVGLWGAVSKSFRVLVQSLVIGLGAWLSLKGEISGGLMIAGSILLGKALGPLDLLIAASKSFSTARESAVRLHDLLDTLPDQDNRMALPQPKVTLRLHNIHAAAPGQREWILRGINLLIPAGTALGVIGPSGSGKTSLLKIIAGIWQTAEGRVFLDAADLTHYNRAQLGGITGYLSQQVELFEGTIAQNISRFQVCDDSDITAAAVAAGVHEQIGQLPQGYATELGPSGHGLSGGMRQRIGLARALFQSPKLLLLDEPNSSLDDAGELALLKAIESQKRQGSTVVLVTHKRSVLRACNLLLVMDRGLVKHFGPTVDVLKQLQPSHDGARTPLVQTKSGV